MTVWTYMKTERHLWTVGFHAPDGTWHPDSDHDNPAAAAARVHWLNGGDREISAEDALLLKAGAIIHEEFRLRKKKEIV